MLDRGEWIRIGMRAAVRAQVKRIHEYKRQFLNVLGIIWRYDQIKKMSPEQRAQVRATWRAAPCLRPNHRRLAVSDKSSALAL